MSKKKNDKSNYFRDWTTKKLKDEAVGYHETIYKVGCYGSHDLQAYHGILNELAERGIEPNTELTF
jgi:hypothetical protein